VKSLSVETELKNTKNLSINITQILIKTQLGII